MTVMLALFCETPSRSPPTVKTTLEPIPRRALFQPLTERVSASLSVSLKLFLR